MARIKIYDLPDEMQIFGENLKQIWGGVSDSCGETDEVQKNGVGEKPKDWKRLASIVYGKI